MEASRRGLLSLVVSQCDSLGRNFEVNDGGSWCGVSSQRLRSGFGDGLWPSERLHVHRVDEEHIAGWNKPAKRGVSGAAMGWQWGGGVDDTPCRLFGEKEWMNSRPAPQPGICTDMWTAWRYSGLQGGTGQARGEGRSLRGDPGWGGHSPAPCFSRSVVELAEPELAFDSSVGSETKV